MFDGRSKNTAILKMEFGIMSLKCGFSSFCLLASRNYVVFVCLNFSILIDEYPDYVNSPIYVYDGVALIVKETVHGGVNGSLLGTFYWNLWLALLLFSLLFQILGSISSKTNRSLTGLRKAIALGNWIRVGTLITWPIRTWRATWVWKGGGRGVRPSGLGFNIQRALYIFY